MPLLSCHKFYILAFLSIKRINKCLNYLAFITGLLLFFSCKKKESHLSDAILSIKETGQLVTAEYVVSKIIKASDDQTWYKIGDRKILMSCEAYLKAGIDFQNINKNNFNLDDSLLTVTLPEATFISLNIPPDKIQLQYQDIGFFRENFSAAEREKLLAQAEQQIKKLAVSLGVLKTAQANAAIYIQTLLQESGYNNVSINFQ